MYITQRKQQNHMATACSLKKEKKENRNQKKLKPETSVLNLHYQKGRGIP